MSPTQALAALLVAAPILVAVLIGLFRWALVVAPADEWLLLVRDGKLVRAGIGIQVWRRPGDTLARFSSTVQRVTFASNSVSREQVPLVVDGFVLWSVVPEADAPFQAFRSLGIANLVRPPAGLKSRQHLLTGPQYRAFQGLIDSEVQQLASSLPFATVLVEREALVASLSSRLAAVAASLGIRFEKVEIHHVRPAEAKLAADLSAPREEEIREQAARVRGESGERIARQELDSKARLAREQDAVAQERRLLEEAAARALATARREREEADFAAKLDRTRREAEAARDAALLHGEADERKTQPVRDHQLAVLTAEKVASAVSSIKDARWVSVGEASPLGSIASLITEVREAIASTSKN